MNKNHLFVMRVISYGVLLVSGFAVGYSVRSRPSPELPELSAKTCYGALPMDQGQVTVNSLEPDGNGGLKLHTERLVVTEQSLSQIPLSEE